MSDDFDLVIDDTVLVRVRERGTSGKLQAKFVAEVTGFSSGLGPGSDYVLLDPPWGKLSSIKLRSTEAEFEKIDRETLR